MAHLPKGREFPTNIPIYSEIWHENGEREIKTKDNKKYIISEGLTKRKLQTNIPYKYRYKNSQLIASKSNSVEY